ncbi:DUF1168-domain-containing protein [Venturia nashicola]|uniref:DUF1168-domain-containing protein n=1 Tax=Venturia nashicola TaxID=86259 RepID=A0A4Z1PC43_9PEZI|nr:DUF1168-domain-containing protein [Venturia nashicola]
MSEPGPDSIPTSADPRSKRPLKKRALTPVSKQAENLEALFAHPEKQINLSAPGAKTLAPPPEIVANVQGSSAGAGSGEFHVYKASRRREYERVKMMDDEAQKQEDDREWELKREEQRKKDEEKQIKNKKRRQKAKQRSNKKKGGSSGDDTKMDVDTSKSDSKAQAQTNIEDEVEQTASVGGEVQAIEENGITIHDED